VAFSLPVYASATRHTIVGLEGELSDAPFIAPDHSQQSKSVWRKRGSELPFRNIVVAESQVFVSQGRKFDD
jgi:hypothetical protein